jgi:hypothetical protein
VKDERRKGEGRLRKGRVKVEGRAREWRGYSEKKESKVGGKGEGMLGTRERNVREG